MLLVSDLAVFFLILIGFPHDEEIRLVLIERDRGLRLASRSLAFGHFFGVCRRHFDAAKGQDLVTRAGLREIRNPTDNDLCLDAHVPCDVLRCIGICSVSMQ